MALTKRGIMFIPSCTSHKLLPVYSKLHPKVSNFVMGRAFSGSLTFETPPNLLDNSRKYLEVLARVDLDRLENNIDHYKTLLSNPRKIILSRNEIDTATHFTDELRTLHYCSFLHPVSYEKNGECSSWYNEESSPLYNNLYMGFPSYKSEAVDNLDSFLHNQKKFIKKIKSGAIDINKPVKEKSLQRYRQYMELVKIYNGKSLSPTFDVDILWHAHMLDHAQYARHTKAFFGCILDHNDSISEENISKIQSNTKEVWDKHFSINKDKSTYKSSYQNSTCCVDDLLYLQMIFHDAESSSLKTSNNTSYSSNSSCGPSAICGSSSPSSTSSCISSSSSSGSNSGSSSGGSSCGSSCGSSSGGSSCGSD